MRHMRALGEHHPHVFVLELREAYRTFRHTHTQKRELELGLARCVLAAGVDLDESGQKCRESLWRRRGILCGTKEGGQVCEALYVSHAS